MNVTLTTLFEAIQLVPLRGPVDDDDWKWTLRSVANRPILRVLPDGTTVVAQSGDPHRRYLKGAVTLLAGSPGQGFGSPSDMTAGFAVRAVAAIDRHPAINGNVGYDADGPGIPSAVLRTTYTNRFNGVFEPSVAITALRLNSPDSNDMPDDSLQALSVTSSDRMVLGDRLEMKLGSELQTIQFMGRVRAFKPFGSADLHLTPNTVVEYQYASSVPDMGAWRIVRTIRHRCRVASGDLSETAPRMSITNFTPAVEKPIIRKYRSPSASATTSMQVAAVLGSPC